MDKVLDRCGLFGVYNNDAFDTAKTIYYGLFSLQHRGTEAAGICVNADGTFVYKKDQGSVIDVFDETDFVQLKGHQGIGHVLRFPGGNSAENAQPIVIRYTSGQMAVAINGGLTNIDELRHELELRGAVFQTMEAAEVVSVLISGARNRCETIEEAIMEIMPKLKGGYSMLVMTPRKVIGVRDPLGIRPLIIGRKNQSWFLSSETCALDELGILPVRDVKPGELVILNQDGMRSMVTDDKPCSALCSFEYIYHSRPDSILNGLEVFTARAGMGRQLAKECPADIDSVIWVPDSGLAAATGYADGLGVPLEDGLVKNRYLGNRFIRPDDAMFKRGINMKLSVIKSRVKGKKIAVVDDSLIRGTTARILVEELREAGAAEVHVRICSPRVKYSCYYGASAPDKQSSLPTEMTAEEICQIIGADSLGFLTVDGMKEACQDTGCGLCTACFDGNYPI